ncbi:MAG: glucose-6-phosphate isomerase [Corynebacteriales bacterium]|nr:glucose-6-phosphate isomerase [Mycobacteriales bacterium]
MTSRPQSTSGPTLSTGGGLSIQGAAQLPGVAPVIQELHQAKVPTKLSAQDPTLWGPEAEAEARIRLGWLTLPTSSRELLPQLRELRAALIAEGLTRVVLAGMGGSSLAPEVICRTLGVELTVLDTTDPAQIRGALTELDRTIVVVSSKSGGTVETDSHRRAFLQAFIDSGLTEAQAGQRFVIVTDPGSPLAATAERMGARAIFLADPNVGGRYSALSAFGLVPSALAGVEVEHLLDEASQLASTLNKGGPSLELGAALGVMAAAGRDKVLLADDGSGIVGFGDWAEQLIAESTGKQGTGILPVVLEASSWEHSIKDADDQLLISVGGARSVGDVPPLQADINVNGSLGAQFLAWEYATAIAGKLLEIDPFDQPNVTESKENTAHILETGLPNTEPLFTDGAIQVYGDAEQFGNLKTLGGVLDTLIDTIPDRGYLAVLAYLDRHGDADAAALRPSLAARTARPVTFGWGPRFLHSTGQYHKGGPQNGVYLQITGTTKEDLEVPGKPYSFGELQAAQAAGDLKALQARNRPTVRLHLIDRPAGLAQLVEAQQ